MAKTKTREITIAQSKKPLFKIKKSGNSKSDYDFEGISALRQLLSNERARLLHAIKTQKPGSIYELAKVLGRSFKAVSDDLKLLERFGFVELVSEKTKNRTRHRPEVTVDTITIHVKV
jgi:predicted transcriptional regulator